MLVVVEQTLLLSELLLRVSDVAVQLLQAVLLGLDGLLECLDLPPKAVDLRGVCCLLLAMVLLHVRLLPLEVRLKLLQDLNQVTGVACVVAVRHVVAVSLQQGHQLGMLRERMPEGLRDQQRALHHCLDLRQPLRSCLSCLDIRHSLDQSVHCQLHVRVLDRVLCQHFLPALLLGVQLSLLLVQLLLGRTQLFGNGVLLGVERLQVRCLGVNLAALVLDGLSLLRGLVGAKAGECVVCLGLLSALVGYLGGKVVQHGQHLGDRSRLMAGGRGSQRQQHPHTHGGLWHRGEAPAANSPPAKSSAVLCGDLG
mmetsp:Transcript_73604/g.196141  ORF Transcript_73604/g.196141 Transcript_73604/m.196141 type:complete len:310 (-) Transcript_73604:18-947(-)